MSDEKIPFPGETVVNDRTKEVGFTGRLVITLNEALEFLRLREAALAASPIPSMEMEIEDLRREYNRLRQQVEIALLTLRQASITIHGEFCSEKCHPKHLQIIKALEEIDKS